jgi:uncharacterized protein YecE (DUF72 family)
MVLFTGTSGWQYDDWRGVLYEPGTPRRQWLARYAERFSTVENNAAFYRLPSSDTFAGWRDATPPGFRMAVKASRYLTHIKRLHDPAEPVQRLCTAVAGLGDRLGPVLLQLPPTLHADVGLLDACLGCFPPEVRVAVEPRHASWWTPEVRAVLTRHNAALCWADRRARPVTPLWRTADWGYLRFHAGLAHPFPRYGKQALSHWAARIAETWPDSADVHAYFNNDLGAAAVLDATAFAAIAARKGRTLAVPPVPSAPPAPMRYP